MSITSEIGIMQGRLSPKINGKIQAFPVENWKNEFVAAAEIGFHSIEWIIEKPLDTNPLLNVTGRSEIKKMINSTGIKVEFICADIFMEKPIVDELGSLTLSKQIIFKLIESCSDIGAKCIEIPFVDNSSIRNKELKYLIKFLNSFETELFNKNIFISIESDLEPKDFSYLLNNLCDRIGANYDIGNSASLGYDFREEIESYGKKIFNLHVKDRKFGGTTIDFGNGDADIKGVLTLLSKNNYDKGIIIQGARGANDLETAQNQLDYTKEVIKTLNNEK